MTVNRRRVGAKGYGYKVDGAKVPGVTTILKMLPKDTLINWAGETTADYAVNHWDELGEMFVADRLKRIKGARFETLGAASFRGTQVHKLGESLVAGAEVVVPDELAGHVEAYRDWLDRTEPVPVATELVVANRTLGYCGTADLVADLGAVDWGGEIIPPARWLLDLKTTASGVWPETALQLSGYQHAEVYVDPEYPDDERPMDWLQIERCGVVWIKSDTCELRPVDTGDEVWDFFQHLAWLYARMEFDLKGNPRLPGHWVGEVAHAANLSAVT